jgi:hypothetical protein
MVGTGTVDTSPAPIRTVPVAHGRSWPARAAVLGAILVAVSVVRPWGDASVTGRDGRDAVVVGAGGSERRDAERPEPTPAPSPRRTLGPDEIECPAAGSQLVSLDRLGTWTVRTWVDAQPAAAFGPDDPTIRTVVLASPAVLGIGVCMRVGPGTPGKDPAAPAPGLDASLTAAWSVVRRDVRPLMVEPISASVGAADMAVLYRPVIDGSGAPGGVSGPRAWPPGRYVLRIARAVPSGPGDAAAADGVAGWFIAVEIPDRG